MPRLDQGPLTPEVKQAVLKTAEMAEIADAPLRNGELFGGWIGRRLTKIVRAQPRWKLQDSLDLASQPIPDEALDGLLQIASKIVADLGKLGGNPEQRAADMFRKGVTSSGELATPERVAKEVGLTVEQVVAVDAKQRGQDPAKAVQDYAEGQKASGPSYLEAVSAFSQQAPLVGPAIRAAQEAGEVLSVVPQTVSGIQRGIERKLGVSAEMPLYYEGGKPGEAAMPVYEEPTQSLLGLPTTITPKQAYERANEMGPGASVAYGAGFQPGTQAFAWASVGFDIALQWKVDPLNVLGKVSAVAKESQLAANIAASGRYRDIVSRTAAQMLSQSPDEVLKGSYAQRGLRSLGEDIRRFASGDARNYNALLERNPVLNNVVRNRAAGGTALLDDIIDAGLQGDEALQAAFSDLMHGKLTGVTTTRLQGRLSALETEVQEAKEALKQAPKDKARKAAMQELNGKITDTKTMLDAPSGSSVVVDRVPYVPTLQRLRQNLRRPADGKLAAVVDLATDSEWARKPFVQRLTQALRRPAGKIPTKDVSYSDIAEGREHMARLGRIMGLSQNQVDDFVNQYATATSFGEARDAYTGMLAAGRKNLPSGLGSDLTRIYDSTANTVYHVDAVGRAFKGWVKKVVRTVRGKDIEIEYDQPGLWSERARSFPLPDVRAILDARSWQGRIRLAMKGHGESWWAQAMRDASPQTVWAGKVGAEVWRTAQHLTSMATSVVWVPMALFRLGWMLRVVGDEQMRLAAVGLNPLDDSMGSIFGRVGKITDTPEEALTDLGRIAMQTRPSKGVLRIGDTGYYQALQRRLLHLNGDRVVQQIVLEGGDTAAVVRWLETDGKQYADDMKDVLEGVANKNGTRGVSLEDWVEHQKQILADVTGGSDELADLVATGKMSKRGNVKLEDTDLADVLQQLPEEALPVGVPEYGTIFDFAGPGVWKKMTSAWFRWAGSKPTNHLSRSPAFKAFYNQELRRYDSLGIYGRGAEEAAKGYALRQVAEILYDSSARTAGDLALRNWAPFLPAWKEVLTRWTHTIPGRMGQGVGQLVFARRLQLLKDSFEDAGLMYQNKDGAWVVKAPGLDWFLSHYYGIKGVQAEVPLASLNMIGNFPFGGGATGIVLAQLVKGNKKLEQALEPLYPFGFEIGGGPNWLSRYLRGIAGGKMTWLAKVNELTASEYQDTLFEGSRMDWLRTQYARFKQIEEMPTGTPHLDNKREAAIQKLIFDSEQAARAIYWKRGLLGFMLPAQPRLYWPGQKESNEFWERFNALEKGKQSQALQAFKDGNPAFMLYAQAKSERLKGERQRNDGVQEYWADFRAGNIKRFTVEEFSRLSLGMVSEQAIRTRYREDLATIGESWVDWANNPDKMLEAQGKRDAAMSVLHNPDYNGIWMQTRARAFARAAERDGKPYPEHDEEALLEVGRLMRIINDKFKELPDIQGSDEGLDLSSAKKFDTSGFKNRLNALREAFNTDRLYSEKELPPGVERDMAEYMESYYTYWDRINEIRVQADNAKTSEERSRAFLEIRKFKDAYKGPTISGQVGPTPEEFSFKQLTTEQRKTKRFTWAASRIQWMSKFQREQLGLKTNTRALKAWEAIDESEIKVREYIREQGWTSSQKEARNLKEAYEAWALDTAKWGGVEDEFSVAAKPRYQRLRAWDFLPEAAWGRVIQTADAVWSVLNAEETGRKSKLGEQLVRGFYPWLESVRGQNPALNEQMNRLQTLSDKKTHYAFYDWLLFED